MTTSCAQRRAAGAGLKLNEKNPRQSTDKTGSPEGGTYVAITEDAALAAEAALEEAAEDTSALDEATTEETTPEEICAAPEEALGYYRKSSVCCGDVNHGDLRSTSSHSHGHGRGEGLRHRHGKAERDASFASLYRIRIHSTRGIPCNTACCV